MKHQTAAGSQQAQAADLTHPSCLYFRTQLHRVACRDNKRQLKAMIKTLTSIAGLILGAISAFAQHQVAIDKIIPTSVELGAGWTSNRVVVLVDPLSSPSERADVNESGWLEFARNLLQRQPRREAYAMIRFFRTGVGPRPHQYLIWIMRWKENKDIPPDWGRDRETKDAPDSLPKIGEAVRGYQRHGMHNDFDFIRGNYLITVEGAIPYGWEELKRLAESIDRRLVNAQNI